VTVDEGAHGERSRDLACMRRAARLGLRGHGGAEPNPMVGCVIVAPDGETLGWGVHRHCGGPHAERAAIDLARAAGRSLAGATAYVTLEPCVGSGRTAPCVDALIEARVARVVYACADPHPKGRGGADALRAAGIEVVLLSGCDEAVALSAPFRRRVLDGRPWIVAKWAMTIDGRVATSVGDSKWISGARSRATVHRERGRVDAIVTGIGTVLADDPQLTARGVTRRRIARRVVVDPELRIPDDCALLSTVDAAPLTIACAAEAAQSSAAAALRARGVEIVETPMLADGAEAGAGHLDLRTLLEHLATTHDTTVALIEAGPRLVGSLLAQGLIDEVWAFMAPRLIGDTAAMSSVGGLVVPAIDDASRWHLVDLRRRGEDAMMRWRSAEAQRFAVGGDRGMGG